MPISSEELHRALEDVIDPELGRSVVELGMVRRAELVGDVAEVTIALTVPGCPLRASFQEQVDRILLPLDGVERVALSFDVLTPEEKQALTTRLRGGVEPRSKGMSVSRRSRRTSPPRSRGSGTRPASSTRTSTASRSRTCWASISAPSRSIR